MSMKSMTHVALAVGIAVVGFSTTAMANNNNYYNYSEAPVPVASPSPYSPADAGIVIGIGGGYADTHWDNVEVPGLGGIDDSGFAGRAFAGYDFNKFFGLEVGYTYLPKATDNFDNDITNYAFDLLAKLSLPVTGGLSIHAKAGGGYLHSNVNTNFEFGYTGDDSRSHFGPAFGVGAAYEIIPNLAIGVDWLRYSGQGKISNTNYQPSPDVVLLDLSYKFPVSFS